MSKLNELTLKEITQLASILSGKGSLEHPYEVGKNYFIRTVTHHYTGHLVAVYEKELVLEKAAWIADDGRFADALEREEFNEVEPYPSDKPVIIGRGAILDAVEIKTIPTTQK